MAAAAPYVELHAHSAFSFLDGASTPAELAGAAAQLGYPAFALTDHDGVWGSMEFVQACKEIEVCGEVAIKPISGAEVTVRTSPAGYAHLTLLVQDAVGYRNLCRLLTAAHSHTRDSAQRSAGQPWVSLEQLEEQSEGLVCLSGCAGAGMLAAAWERGDAAAGAESARRLLGAFGRDHFRIELQRPFWRRDRGRNRWLAGLAERLGVAAVATGNVHSHAKHRAHLQDAFVATRLGMTLEESESMRRGNRSSALRSPRAMAECFADHPDAVAETLRLAERLEFDLSRELGYHYPRAEEPGVDCKLAELCRSLLAERYAGSRHRLKAESQLGQELETIRALGLSGFFLLHHDLLVLAREVAAEVRGRNSARSILPPGRGRGSSVSSIVCYLTGLSHIDPVANNLNSSRFLNEEVGKQIGATMPDIDLDFPRDIREVLIPRVHERYGAEHSALVAAFPTYRPRAAVRDLGKALGLPTTEIDRVAKMVGFHERSGEIEKDAIAAIGPERAATPRWQALLRLCPEAMGLPRHASQHSGGMVISTRPLIDVCPVVPAAMEGRQIVQWDKDSCNDAGLLKIDLLGLGMLSAVERCVDEVRETRGEALDLSRIPFNDPETFRSIRAAETTGVFQIESRAQMSMLPRTRPQNLDDLTVQVALVRPGPIQGGAVHPYIERLKRRREDPGFEVPYEHPLLKGVLEYTLGTIVFQEQVIEVAIALAGFSPAQADSLRRAMSRKRSLEEIEKHHKRFIGGAKEKRVPEAVAEKVWGQIKGFSGFGFPRAHSAAFGLLAYQSAWLRVHRPQEFLCALLNEQPMGFYPPDALVHEAQRRGVQVVGPDANRSRALCHVEPIEGELAVRIGLGYVKGVRKEQVESLVTERERSGNYAGIADLASRSGAGRDDLERLAWAGALDDLVGRRDSKSTYRSFSVPSAAGRREALWEAGGAGTGVRHGEDVQMALPLEPPRAPELKPLGDWERLIASYRSIGITLDAHPLGLMRDDLDAAIQSSADLERAENGATVAVAGFVVARQRPGTANGIVFMLLEDEFGTVNLVVPPPVYEHCRAAVRAAPLVRALGRLERHEGTTNVVVGEVVELEIPKASARRGREGTMPRARGPRTVPRCPAGPGRLATGCASTPSPSCVPPPPPATVSVAGDKTYYDGGMEGRRRANFRQATNTQGGAVNPRELFRDLPRDEDVPFLWGHQERILEAYEDRQDASDVALELPTGTGKTLIGLLIGEWRRRNRSERVLYLCPTRQLAHQVGAMAGLYGIDAEVCLAPDYGGIEEWQNSDAVAISTYSSLFNYNPRFTEPRTLILDDAHAADGYVASHWTVTIDRDELPETYRRVADLLAPSVGHRTAAMMMSDEPWSVDRSGVELIPLPQWWPFAQRIEEILDQGVDGTDQWYAWAHHVRDGLGGCCLLASWKEIVIRPAIPTTKQQLQFAEASQRIYMSATLGYGGDLERIFGVRRIERLPVPDEWERRSTGRRLFLFPSASLGRAEVEDLIADSIDASGRAVVLTPTQSDVDQRRRILGEAGIPTVEASEIEENLDAFTQQERAALVLANRYDGIDLPGDDCRLLIIDGLPVAVNILERFLYQRLTATNLLMERVRTRLTQGVGRCTRGEGDWSAVLIISNTAYDFCARPGVQPLFHPELQGELKFGLDESRDRSAEEFLDLLEIFREHGEEWEEADGQIRQLREQATRGEDPGADQLEGVVAREVDYTYAMREGNFPLALEHAVAVADGLGGDAAAAYRSWWLYQAGAAAWMANHAFAMPEMVERARDLFRRAMESGPALPWFAELAYGDLGDAVDPEHSPGDLLAAERVHSELTSAGFHGQEFSRQTRQLEERLAGGEPTPWELGVTDLGRLLGFEASHPDGQNAPDSVWIATDSAAIVWEIKSGENPNGEVGARTAQQVNGHVNWVREHCDLADDAEIIPLLVSDRERLGEGADVHAGQASVVSLNQVRRLAAETIGALSRVRAIGGDADAATVRENLLAEFASSGKLPSQLGPSLAERRLASLPR